MQYEPKSTLDEFNRLMADIRKSIPDQYQAFISQKDAITKEGTIPEKIKWLLLLVSSVTEKCPVCIPRAVQHCLDMGWSKKEMLEACMVAVLVGGSSVMTYVTLVDKTIQDLSK
ncbi:MAG: carboxymuconolactone decarboxylase family protein [Candidatus Omnitrophica bacterium]|nr:carboxymuconolactone decarboxylase family protein [Candidatus Omnitrophota bacterium]